MEGMIDGIMMYGYWEGGGALGVMVVVLYLPFSSLYCRYVRCRYIP